jgi:hypothetical protein
MAQRTSIRRVRLAAAGDSGGAIEASGDPGGPNALLTGAGFVDSAR